MIGRIFRLRFVVVESERGIGREHDIYTGRRLMKINLTSIYVDDQEKALRFHTAVMGFEKKADFSNGPYRWLTVGSLI